ncbi:MAG: hypothetical protein KAV82_16135 [Phycisphaerae bacterium]|nr:hypothetical protein [Phycisphaerae bacterium]
MTDDHPAKEKGSTLVFWLIVGCVVVLVLAAFVFYVLGLFACSISDGECNAVNKKWALLGTFGDSFGAMNALFSGVALIGVVVALIYQRRELGGQLEELQKSVKHQAKQLHWTSQAEILKTTRELVLLGLSNEEFTSWMTGQNWSRRERYIQLWINAFFLAWQANVLELGWGSDYWEGNVKEMKLFFGYQATRTWWSQAKEYYPDRFVNKIDAIVGDSGDAETNGGTASSP